MLLEFDVHMLKEIDIPAFGKRMRIASAIQELRRPASITSSDAASVVPNRAILPFPNPGAHSYNSSLSSAAPHSANSPLSYMQMQQQQVLYNGGEMAEVPEMEPRSRAETVVPTLGHGSQTIGPVVTTKVRHHCSLYQIRRYSINELLCIVFSLRTALCRLHCLPPIVRCRHRRFSPSHQRATSNPALLSV